MKALLSLGIAFGFARSLGSARHPARSVSPRHGRVRRRLGTMLKYTKNQTYLLYLLSTRSGPGILSTAAPGVGPAHRPICAALANVARSSDARKSLSSGTARIVPGAEILAPARQA